MNRHILKSSLCQHRMPSGRQCRMEAVAETGFCTRHATVRADPVDPNLEAELTSGLEKFDSPAAINDFLTRLAHLLAQDRISPRRAAVLAYISNQILRSVSAIGQEEERNRVNQPVEYIIGVPRPDYDEPEPGSQEANNQDAKAAHEM